MRATYRLQMRNGFDFAAAERTIPYLARLGVSHLYLSPIFTAAPGSTHGYDIVDPNEIEPALGGRAGFDDLVRRAREHELGIVLDIVPNHLAAHENNGWWRQMLRDGPDSVGASVFDAAWDENGGRLVLPVLGADPAREIEKGDLVLDVTGDEPVIRYHDRWYPVAPGTADGAISEVLGRQHYELAQWRSGLERLAYRRFFDVTDLAGVRVEDPAVFDLTHRLVMELVERGLVDVLRVDHVDGLADPAAYLERLAARAAVPIYVEKILTEGEQLPESWPIAGTTGYEALSDLLLLHVDAAGLRKMDREYRERDDGRDFGDVEHEAKEEMLHSLFAPELARVSARLHAALAADPSAGPAIGRTVARLTVELDVYRSYVGLSEAKVSVSETDRERLRRVIDRAREDLDPAATPYAAQLWSVLTDPRGQAARRFVTTWQQLSGPVMAKGHEDTALYRHVRLLATNEVGVEPDAALNGAALNGDAVDRFHEHARERQARYPAALVTTATHDTKRGEDTRLRIALLSEAPGEWRRGFDLWLEAMEDRLETTAPPTRREQRLIAQTILGAWPIDDAGWGDFADRVVEYVRKAAREAKETTSWLEPDEAHEDGLEAFVRVALEQQGASFQVSFGDLLTRLGPAAAAASIGQVVLKIAGPGVADLYQGAEGWDLSLVDPDNRRPVDFDRAARRLDELEAAPPAATDLLVEWPDGRVKQWVTRRALEARAADPALFLEGDYQPLTVRGPRSAHAVAFARRLGDRMLVAVASRGCLALSFPEVSGPPSELWRDTSIEAPAMPEGETTWTDQLTGAVHQGAELPLAAVLGELPAALLLSSG